MAEVLINYHLPFLVMALIVGYQISVYFLYEYFSKKEEKLELNKILLAYGTAFGFLITAVLIRTFYTYYIQDVRLNVLFFELSHVFVAIAAVSFLITIYSGSFSKIINQRITNITLIAAVLLSGLIFLIYDLVTRAVLILIAFIIAGSYLFIFHYRLLAKTTTNIRKRLRFIIFGAILIMLGIFMQADEFILLLEWDFQVFFMIMSAPIFIIGELIVFLGVFRFPAFLEFGWTKNLIALYIMNLQDSHMLFQFHFASFLPFERKNENFETKEDYLSRGILGIDQVVSRLIDSHQKGGTIIKQENVSIMVEPGDNPYDFISYILLIKKEMKSFEVFLRRVKREFQDRYKSVLNHLDAFQEKHEIFANFNNNLKKIIQ
ncbi:MAG: hypothetical protein ACOC44_14675 [Promethearchaeia archaeon]